MQLATRQRPHPPPVPPRPSRHVVAEALKRTPRPPCPTRQAPPPPNIRPWRSEDHETAAGGRTVVYESARENQSNGEQVRCSSEPPRSSDQLQRPLASPRSCCNDETLAHVGIEIAANICQTEQREIVKSEGAAGHKQQSLVNNSFSISDDDISAHNQTQNSAITHLPERKNDSSTGAKEQEIREEETDKRIFVKSTSVRDEDEYSEIYEREINFRVNDNISKQEVVVRTRISSEDDERSEKICSPLVEKEAAPPPLSSSCSSSPPPPLLQEEARLSTTPTRFEKKPKHKVNDGAKLVGVCEDDEKPIIPEAVEESISSDDCATVVVIDEPERKIGLNDDNDNIYHQDWLEAGIRYSSTKITLPGDDLFDRADDFSSIIDNHDDEHPTYTKLDHPRIRERMSMSSLQGLPPLPRSLSGFNLSEGRRESAEPPPPPTRSSSKTQKNFKSTQPSSSRPSPPGRQVTTLDTQLAILRKEMFGLRQLDLSLLSQLWSLNESIQEFRQLLQEQEDRAPSPSPSSEEGDDNSYGSHPPPPPRRPAPLLHHHRPPRPPRPLRPPASDESPSSEEYGAV